MYTLIRALRKDVEHMKLNSKISPDEIRETITLLQKKRIYLNLTQRETAQRVGIPLSTYQKFETGERNIWTASFKVTCKVLYALELNPDDFFRRRYVIREPKKESPVILKKGRKDNGRT